MAARLHAMFSSVRCICSFAVAGSASPRASIRNVGIVLIEWMSEFAMRFRTVPSIRSSFTQLLLLTFALFASADTAKASPCFCDTGVLRGVFVSVIAVGTAGEVGGGSISTKDVDLHGYRLKMVWVNAQCVSAKMIQSHSLRNRTVNLLPSPPPCSRGLTEEPVYSTIASSCCPSPYPTWTEFRFEMWRKTAVFVNLFPQLLRSR